MTLSPDMPLRAALWRVSSADRSPNCKIGVSGDSLFHANGVSNGRMRQRDRAFDGGAWSNRAVRGRRARMNRGTERSGKPRGSIEAHTFACCPPEHFCGHMAECKDAPTKHRLVPEMVSAKTLSGDGGSNPSVSPNCHPKQSRLCGVAAGFIRALGGRDSRKATNATGNSRPASGHALSLTFAVSTPEGRGPNVGIGHVTPVALHPCERKTRSRYQSRPDCNPSPQPVQPSFDCDVSSPSPTIHLHTHP